MQTPESKEGAEEKQQYTCMKEITQEDYKNFLNSHKEIEIENTKVELFKKWAIKQFAPSSFAPQTTTVWSFPDRGDWATHKGNYRGNWSPFIPRNLILRYTQPGDLVLDQMAGSGTTLVECKLLGRRAIAVDINPDAVMVTRNRLDFTYTPLDADYQAPEIKTYAGDARSLNLIKDNSIDLIATHPPYAGIIPYSHDREGDLSSVHNIQEFIQEMQKVANECMRILKPGSHCAILMGDSRKHAHFIPITPRVLQAFLEAGFILRENIIKLQWNMKGTRENWMGKKYNFLLIGHENLYVFRKADEGENTARFRESMKWW
ncbi:MAG: DNA methyltransferase [Candidatus Methanoperedens sp.]|nr:DNA methyltransferase [Candidatus Methanoperedens sp.]